MKEEKAKAHWTVMVDLGCRCEKREGEILSKGYEYAISRHASFIGKPLVHDKSRNYSGP